jgi:fructokinase
MQYIATALANIVCVLSPQRIILGGSVCKGGQLGQTRFLGGVRERLQRTLAGYVASPALSNEGIGSYVSPPGLGDNAGICGAIALAQSAYNDQAGHG